MKGGCFGKILTFIFGVVIGFVLFAGTLAGAGYFLVTQVTVADVEDISKTQLIPNKDAEIRTKSLLDIYNMLRDGKIKNITVQGVYDTFGFDLIEILEKSLDIEIKEGENKEALKVLPVLQLFQGDNLKILLNSVTLNDILRKTGISGGLIDKPLIAEHLEEPVVDAFNAIVRELDFNKLTIGEMEYLLGMSFGEGVLDNLKGHTINSLNSALNDIKIEDVVPNFDRDYYFLDGDPFYYANGYVRVEFAPAYELIPDAELAATEASARYKLNDDGTVAQADDGLYRLIGGVKPYIEDLYVKNGEDYTQNRKGFFKVTDGTKPSARFSLTDGAYTADTKGQYKVNYTSTENGTPFRHSYVKKFVEIEGEWKLEKRGLVEATDVSAAQTFIITVVGENKSLTPWTEGETGDKYILAHTGTTERILQTLADMSLNSINTDIGNLKLGEVVEITADSSNLLQELKDTPISGLAAEIDNMKLNKIIDIIPQSVVTADANGTHIALPEGTPAYEYAGDFIPAVTEGSENIIKLVKYQDGIDGTGSFFAGQDRYNITTEASQGILAAIGELTVKQLSTGMDDVIKNAKIRDVMTVNGDVYIKKFDNYTQAQSSGLTLYVYYDIEKDLLVEMNNTHTTADAFYEKIYVGEDNAVVKKLTGIKVDSLATRIDTVINETKLKEVLSVEEKYIMVANEAGEYIELPALAAGKSYYGSYNVGINKADNNEILFVKFKDGMTGIRYAVDTAVSNGVFIKMADKKIGELTGEMQGMVDDTKMSEIVEISGDVYTKLEAATFDAAYTEAAGSTMYYKANNGIFRFAGYVRDNNGNYVNVSGSYVAYDVSNPDHEGLKRYARHGDTATEFFVTVYEGTSNPILKKIAGLNVKTLATGNTLNDAVEDCTLEEIGVADTSDTGSFMYRLKDYRIEELKYALEDVLSEATIRELNTWGGLGMSEDALKALNMKVYYDYCTATGTTPDTSYAGTDPQYDMTAKDFLSKLSITYNPTTNDIEITLGS